MTNTLRFALIAGFPIALLMPGIRADEEKDPPKGPPALELPRVAYPEAETAAQKKAVIKHKEGSQKLAGEQDELSADVQDLIEEQTNEKLIVLLEEVEEIMAEVTGSLDETNTSGETIAAETEIIEKIFEAAKQRAQQSGGT
ncbi:MAG: hypothetical protein CMP28_03335 [Roseibacillus sp.]|nr:hypothetical protein [Roseibacillus sp.]